MSPVPYPGPQDFAQIFDIVGVMMISKSQICNMSVSSRGLVWHLSGAKFNSFSNLFLDHFPHTDLIEKITPSKHFLKIKLFFCQIGNLELLFHKLVISGIFLFIFVAFKQFSDSNCRFQRYSNSYCQHARWPLDHHHHGKFKLFYSDLTLMDISAFELSISRLCDKVAYLSQLMLTHYLIKNQLKFYLWHPKVSLYKVAQTQQ